MLGFARRASHRRSSERAGDGRARLDAVGGGQPWVRRAASLAATLSFSFVTPRIWAQAPSPAGLSWNRLSGAESCPGPAELARRVDALLKRSAFVGPSSATRFFQVSVQPNVGGAGWQTHIVVSNEANETLGTRDISVPQEACSHAV